MSDKKANTTSLIESKEISDGKYTNTTNNDKYLFCIDNLPKENQDNVNNNKILSTKKITPYFIFKHYSKVYSFANEISRTQGITVKENNFIRHAKDMFLKFQRYGGYAFISLTAFTLHKLLYKRTKIISLKMFYLASFIFIFLDFSHKFGRHLGGFFILHPFMNRFLNYGNGESIISLQTYLFIKTCLIEEELIKLKKIKPTPWKDSFVLDQVFGEFRGKMTNKIRNFKQSLF